MLVDGGLHEVGVHRGPGIATGPLWVDLGEVLGVATRVVGLWDVEGVDGEDPGDVEDVLQLATDEDLGTVVAVTQRRRWHSFQQIKT